MIIVVGSANPVKINAVKQAIVGTALAGTEVVGVEVASGVPAQPWGSEETRQGAVNRARAALTVGQDRYPSDEVVAVGFEGGVHDVDGEVWSRVWCSVIDQDNNHFETSGAIFKLAEPIATQLRNGGELGPIMDGLTQGSNTSQNQGAIGVITNGFVTRTEEYTALAKLAVGVWYGRNWQAELSAS